MENLFNIKVIKAEDNPHYVEGGSILCTHSGIPYSQITFFSMAAEEGKDEPTFLIKKEDFDFEKLLNENGTVFWEKSALAFKLKDKYYISPQIPDSYVDKIKKNGLFTLRVIIDNNYADDFEIEELGLCA